VGGLLLGGAGGAWNSSLSGSQQALLGLGASTAAGAASSAIAGGDPLEGAALGLTAAALSLGLNRIIYTALSSARNRVTIYRGVAEGHPGYEDAVRGVVKPRGGHENPYLHNEGDTRSEFTSWTTNRAVAERFTEGKGIVLQMTVDKSKLIYSPDYYGESEVLIQGPVSGARVNYIDRR
jgi:hypothetical protein